MLFKYIYRLIHRIQWDTNRRRQSHSCVEKAAMIGFVKLRILDTDEKFQLRGATLAAAIDVSRP